MTTLTNDDYDALDRITDAHHENARNKGFVTLHERLVQHAAHVRVTDPELADYMLMCEAGNELMLIVTELGEAHEEIRTSPYPMDVTYFRDEQGNPTLEEFDAEGNPRKPEGLGSELETLRKAFYNATRALRHGGKKF
jgi:hypothetical protein